MRPRLSCIFTVTSQETGELNERCDLSFIGVELNRRSLLLGIGCGRRVSWPSTSVRSLMPTSGSARATGLTRETFLECFPSRLRVYTTGFRRNHAKGVAVTGHFDSNGNGSELSRAAVFRPGQYAGDRTILAVAAAIP